MNLTTTSRHTFTLIVLACLAVPLAAQQPQRVPQPQAVAKVQLAFGYECADKFALRNEGAAAVTVEYAVVGTTERGSATVQPNETVQLESASPNDIQLYVDGKLVATESKGNRACADAPVMAGGAVMVRHFEPTELVYVQPTEVYVEPTELVYVRPWSYGYYPYAGPVIRIGWGGGYPYYRGPRGGLPRPIRPPIMRDGDRPRGGNRDGARGQQPRSQQERPQQPRPQQPRPQQPQRPQQHAAPPRSSAPSRGAPSRPESARPAQGHSSKPGDHRR